MSQSALNANSSNHLSFPSTVKKMFGRRVSKLTSDWTAIA
jgi:hypothetical protein